MTYAPKRRGGRPAFVPTDDRPGVCLVRHIDKGFSVTVGDLVAQRLLPAQPRAGKQIGK